MAPESWHIPIVLSVILAMILLLVTDRFKSSLVFVLAVGVFLVSGIIDMGQFVEGLSNISILTIFLLIIITSGINEYFNLSLLLDYIFKSTRTARGFILKMGTGVAGLSAFMNNTPVVAMMMPYVYDWGRRNKVNPSQLLMPLSYAAILGGVITLIGTSTNLVLNGLMEESGMQGFAFFDFLVPGLLITIACMLAMLVIIPLLLGNKKTSDFASEEIRREYLVETKVLPNAAIIGKTVERAGLRNLEGVFLAEIIRDEHQIAPVSPAEYLQEGDVLLFAGDTSTILDLVKQYKGLEFSKDRKFKLPENADIIEAVVAQNSGIDRQTVKDIGFREKFDAAIIGIHRQGQRLTGKIGSIALHTGDLLLMTTGPDFRKRNGKNRDLIIINKHQKPQSLSGFKRGIFLTSLAVSVLLVVLGITKLFESLLIIGFTQILLKMITMEKLKRAISYDLLLVLVSALALGKGLIDSGAADWVTEVVFAHAETWQPIVVLAVIFGVTFILTSMITNVAAISIIFPVIYSLSLSSSIPTEALFLTAAYGASCCFATPFSYQTNMMISELGNYKFKDFLKVGIPLSIVYGAVLLYYMNVTYLQ